MKIKILFFSLALLLATLAVGAQSPKREFRGAWIQCVNGQFQGMTAQKMQGGIQSGGTGKAKRRKRSGSCNRRCGNSKSILLWSRFCRTFKEL